MKIFAALRAFAAKRCPRCHRGAIYKAAWDMHQKCPECGLVYERERGYFIGSLYISYFYAIVILGTFTLIGSWLFLNVDLGFITLGAIVAFIPFVPETTRYSRVTWMYVDRWIWPERAGEP